MPSILRTDGIYGTATIRTVSFKVYTVTDDDGTTTAATVNEMTSATGTCPTWSLS